MGINITTRTISFICGHEGCDNEFPRYYWDHNLQTRGDREAEIRKAIALAKVEGWAILSTDHSTCPECWEQVLTEMREVREAQNAEKPTAVLTERQCLIACWAMRYLQREEEWCNEYFWSFWDDWADIDAPPPTDEELGELAELFNTKEVRIE